MKLIVAFVWRLIWTLVMAYICSQVPQYANDASLLDGVYHGVFVWVHMWEWVFGEGLAFYEQMGGFAYSFGYFTGISIFSLPTSLSDSEDSTTGEMFAEIALRSGLMLCTVIGLALTMDAAPPVWTGEIPWFGSIHSQIQNKNRQNTVTP